MHSLILLLFFAAAAVSVASAFASKDDTVVPFADNNGLLSAIGSDLATPTSKWLRN